MLAGFIRFMEMQQLPPFNDEEMSHGEVEGLHVAAEAICVVSGHLIIWPLPQPPSFLLSSMSFPQTSYNAER